MSPSGLLGAVMTKTALFKIGGIVVINLGFHCMD